MKLLTKRLLSIDVLRAVIMFLMIFVNDLSGVKDIPSWIDHAAANDDALGFADIIFPSFLFITGLSIPFALQNRMKVNDSTYEMLSHIITRSAALIIMGLYQVNLDEYSSASWLPKAVWALIVTSSFFMIWLDYPKNMNKFVKYRIVLAGAFLLLIMAILYKTENSTGITGMRTYWWGILGIIGWTYFIAAVIYYFLRRNLNLLLICLLLFAGLNIAEHIDLIENKLWLIGDASSVTLTFAGIVFSTFYIHCLKNDTLKKFRVTITIAGAAVLIAGFLLRPYADGISKIRSTPAWVFICMGITILVWQLFIYLVDRLGKKDLFKFIRPAGTSTLTCYLMPYFFVYILSLFHVTYPSFLNEGIGGIIRSLVISFFLIWLVGLMEKKNLTIKI